MVVTNINTNFASYNHRFMKKTILIMFISLIGFVAADAQAVNLKHLGDSCMQCYDTFHALQYYEQALAKKDNAELHRRIAECYFRRADYNRCIEALKKISIFDNDSLDHEALREMFYSYQYLSQPEAQLHWGKAILERYPMDAEVVAKVAELYNREDINQPQKALSLTLEYILKDSTNIAVLRQLADAYFFMKMFEGAPDIYKMLLSLGDSTYNVLYSLGMCYDQTKNLPMAYKYLKKATEINDNKNAGCLYRLGIVCVDMDKPDEGFFYLNRAYEMLQPDSTVMFVIKRAQGEGYYKSGKWKMAIDAWRDALKLNGTSIATYFNIAQAYGILKDKKNEAEYFRTFLSMAVKMEPNDGLTKMLKQAESVVGKP